MRRREFIQCLLPLAGWPLVYPMWSVASGRNAPHGLRKFADIPDDGRVLVLVQLAGGNDGLNTIVPYGDDAYYAARPQLGVDKSRLLPLNEYAGLHPALEKLRPVYDNGDLAIVQGVGYPNPNRSHFKSTDIWLTASDANDLQDTGWLGRYFDAVCPPAEGNSEAACGRFGPPAIQIGLTSSLALMGRNPKGIALRDPLAFYTLVSRQGQGHGSDPSPELRTPAQRELHFLRETASAAFEYAEEIKQAAEKGKNAVTYPDTSLAAQLAVVAQLIAGGLTTRIYIVSIKGFDTHAGQQARHEALLAEVAGALATFQADLAALGLSKRVVGMCFSEFGRRVAENASRGTDHGTAAPLLLFGAPVQGGLHGVHPSLTDLDGSDLKHTVDFRQLYATVLEDWLGAAAAAILGAPFPTLPLVDNTTGFGSRAPVPRSHYLAQNYPNPFNPLTTIEFGLHNRAEVELCIFNAAGRRVATLVRGTRPAGIHRLTWDAGSHASGLYLLRLRGPGIDLTRKMQVVK